MRRALVMVVAAAAPIAVVALYLGVTLPPRAVALTGTPATVVFGAYHIHTDRSDGSGTVDDVAAAAAEAGLRFVILTDHGDATRAPLAPAYRHGVLVLDAVEINTASGHLVALGLTAPAPYPLAGEARDVLDDVHRLGGWGVVAHPDSPRPDLSWRAWNVPYDGLEWINADAEWRRVTRMRLVATAGRYVMRPAEVVATLFAKPAATLRRWDVVSAERSVVALGAVDAHAPTLLRVPSYRAMFGTINQGVLLDHPLSGQPADDAASVLTALRRGQTFTLIRAFAGPASLSFSATAGNHAVARMGEALDPAGGPVTFVAQVPEAPGARVVLLHGGATLRTGQGRLEFTLPAVHAGSYRVEAYFPGQEVPWLVSNPITIGPLPGPPPSDSTPAAGAVTPLPMGAWTIEHDPTAQGALAADGAEWRMTYSLSGGAPASQYAALVSAVEGDAGFDRVQFTARADQPMRISVQVRLLGGRDGLRWRRSVYLDAQPRPVVIPLREFEPVGMATSQRPIVARIRSVLFVVDTLNTSPGSRGTFWISKVGLGVGSTERQLTRTVTFER